MVNQPLPGIDRLAAVELAIKQHHPEIVNAMFQSAPNGVPEEEWQRLRKELGIE